MTKQAFWNLSLNSATILWARIQILLGSIIAVVLVTDMTPFLPPKYLVWWVPINGIITEYLRRVNTETHVIQVKQHGEVSDVRYMTSKDPVPEGAKLVSDKKLT